MKYTFAAAALVAVASAQSLSDIPSCAVPCIDEARTSSTSCGKEDYACICKNQEALIGVATTCVLKDCGADKALNEVLPAVKTFCEKVAAAPAPAPSSSAAATSDKPTAEPTTTMAEPTTMASSSGYVVTSMTMSVSASGSMTTAAPSTMSVTSATSASASVPHSGSSTAVSSPIATAGAAHFGIGGAGVLAAIAAFL